MSRSSSNTFGESNAALESSRAPGWVDLLIVAGLVGALYGLTRTVQEWTGALRPTVDIDLSPTALPRYAFFSLCRGLIAYVFSLGFTLAYGYWAAKDARAERVLLPLLDILQSIPVLGFMPGLVLALVAAFPRSNVGLELAAVVMIFTGQAWNMTFSYYHSLRSVPQEQREAATVYRFNGWQRLRWVELPFATIGLVWNSMMSMAGGWFFLMINEAFVLGDRDFRLPGLGSYMSVAVARGDSAAMAWAVLAMTAMIVLLDQLLWRPVVVWAQKFRTEEGGEVAQMGSWFLTLLRRSTLVAALKQAGRRRAQDSAPARPSVMLRAGRRLSPRLPRQVSHVLLVVLVLALLVGAGRLMLILRDVPLAHWGDTLGKALLTLGRVLLATCLGTVWAVPAGLAIGLSPRLSRLLQPVIQVVASFPAPMLFPMVIAALTVLGVGLGWGSMWLMLLGTQWYILFNVVAGATAIPADLREMAASYRLGVWRRFWSLYLPAVFPYLVTGWVTAAGGAWNASIVSEYVTFRGHVLTAPGLGSQISEAAASANFPLLSASVVVMSVMVVTFNRLVWRRLHRLAETRFSLSK
ncbi:ABC transporter permease [Corallococcus sp. H22C18031201]|uniref:ABC transporter permease n=1 Tax=Citreicoccus inhibens TaxID=2849499 RepID=UPI000E740C86|nr:ABC transporter permease subunit [Citreicoccus inhibens]MBU8893994.1 ABC transporter permease subunit [Citreicoccus inhibens]RJS23281.1 ABC transporter permease [Corallococcus sp. H22C18031201]